MFSDRSVNSGKQPGRFIALCVTCKPSATSDTSLPCLYCLIHRQDAIALLQPRLAQVICEHGEARAITRDHTPALYSEAQRVIRVRARGCKVHQRSMYAVCVSHSGAGPHAERVMRTRSRHRG